MPSAWPYAAYRRLADADLALEHCEYLLAQNSHLYSASAHGRARADLEEALDDVLDAVRARRLLLSPPAPPAEGDAPPLPPPPEYGERPAGRISESVHG